MVDYRRELESNLSSRIEGEVRFDRGSRAIYATDASNYRQVPIGVVLPKSKDDVIATLEACRQHGAPVLARGGGTSLAGQCCNVAVVLDMSKYYNDILDLDPDRRTARIQPGLVLDDLRHAANRHGLTFGPDPATHSHCTLGGMMGNNSCGIHSVLAGKTVDNIVSLEVLTYDGAVLEVGRTDDERLRAILEGGGRKAEIFRALRRLVDDNEDAIRDGYPHLPRRVSGYNLDELLPDNGFDVARALIGSEGTLVTILEATVELIEWPAHRSLVVVGYDDVFEAADQVPEILRHDPIGLEGIDVELIGYMRKKGLNVDKLQLLPEGRGWLLVEFGGDTKNEADDRARAMIADLRGSGGPRSMELYDDPERERMVWEVRESGLGATARVPGEKDTWPGWEDSAVHPEVLGDYLRDLRALFDRYDLKASLYGHFGQGCVHCRIPFDLRTAAGLEAYRDFVGEAAELCCGKYGGSLSGEHGDGIARGPLLPHMYSAELIAAMRQFKGIWDPDDRMNPGRIVEAASVTDHLRLGPDYAPATPETRFAYADDDGDFARAVLRCVGVGKCRRESGGTMCPSYMATREEKHSTRGRARMLFEMLNGEEIGGWRDDAVLETLDLCLGCKGCKSDCPVSVDMATYKTEFLSHHWAGRLRPRVHYAMGLIPWGARLASLAPRLVNRITGSTRLSGLVKLLAGITPERKLPRFAEQTFLSWLRRRDDAPAPRTDRPRVVLFVDTFNNHFHPEVARAAVEFLEWAGCRVSVPERTLCCGRPLLHYGMLDLAARQQQRVIDTLRPEVRAGVPVVGLEPSCVAALRDELLGLFPDDQDARRVAGSVMLFSEFVDRHLGDIDLPRLDEHALLHVHCHQKSVLSRDTDEKLLNRLGVECDVPDSGCCGMAGSFGYERGKYDVSAACGERVLLPAVRDAGDDVAIVSSGYSCREQIEQLAGRHAQHVAQIARRAVAGVPPNDAELDLTGEHTEARPVETAEITV
ncbi:MAG: FAD-linked oxidase C-terminal domain-containing protein [Acidobacteriota bacterium]|jgi:FAD/FMN-containing dehydrogenase/Fe-S oxidoreductase